MKQKKSWGYKSIMKEKEVKKDKHCVGCGLFWTCKGKPHRNPCLNKVTVKQEEKGKRNGNL